MASELQDTSAAPYPTMEEITPRQIAECVHHLKGICSDAQQLAMLQWLEQQDGHTMMAVLGQFVTSIPQEQLPALIEEHIGTQPEEVKLQIHEQIMKVYRFFLSCTQTGTVTGTYG